jgi:hypothetical protein
MGEKHSTNFSTEIGAGADVYVALEILGRRLGRQGLPGKSMLSFPLAIWNLSRDAYLISNSQIEMARVANEASLTMRPAQNRRGRKIGLAMNKMSYADTFGVSNGQDTDN